MKNVIINADDFGLTSGINRGIVQAHQNGVLTSASLMANMPGFDEAVLLAKGNPSLGVGVHLNLIRGRSILPKKEIPSLVDDDNRFSQSGLSLLSGIITKRIKLNDIKKELEAQVNKVIDAGIEPSHLDGEKHSHLLPGIADITANLAKAKGIKCIRLINERITVFNNQACKCLILNALSKKIAALVKRNDLITTDRFFGVVNTGSMDARAYIEIFNNLSGGSYELMSHPGYVDEELSMLSQESGGYFINKYREIELNALLDPRLKKIAKDLGIQFINFHDLGRRKNGYQ